jgi:hypothetical protein
MIGDRLLEIATCGALGMEHRVEVQVCEDAMGVQAATSGTLAFRCLSLASRPTRSSRSVCQLSEATAATPPA